MERESLELWVLVNGALWFFACTNAHSLWILACTGEVNAGGRRRSGFVQLVALNWSGRGRGLLGEGQWGCWQCRGLAEVW